MTDQDHDVTVAKPAGVDPARWEAARTYLSWGWPLFVLGELKRPLPNCPACPSHGALERDGVSRHDASACDHLTCHGFYSATTDLARLAQMWRAHPAGLLATRCGAAPAGNGLVVLDGDGDAGVNTLVDFEQLTGVELPQTRRQKTGGGLHLLYRLPPGASARSRTRVLEGLDVRGDLGYVALPPGPGRSWMNPDDDVAMAPAALLTWLAGARGGRGGGGAGGDGGDGGVPPGGYDYQRALTEGARAGERDHFVNDLAFRLRKSGAPRAWVEQSARAAWERMEQPAGDEYPWEQVVTKLNRAWDTVELDAPAVTGVNGHVEQQVATIVNEAERELHLELREPQPTGGSPDNPWRVTDRANGEEVALFLRGRALWVPEARKEWRWVVWDGRRWVADTQQVCQLLVTQYVDTLRRQATSNAVPQDEATVLMGRATRLESATGLANALRFAGPLLSRSVTEFDRDPWTLTCPNGVVDLRTGELLPHDPARLTTRLCPTVYEPKARDATWTRVVREALENDEARMRLLGRFAGYSLTGLTTEKRFLVLTGPANTGKSTVTEAFYHTLGDLAEGGYATVWDADVVQLNSQVNRGEKLAKSRAARFVLVGELAKGSRMADNFVKQFTGGDTMDARALYEASYSYRPQAKLWMATNYVPASADPALHERLIPLPFQHVPTRRDPKIKRHLDEDEGAHRAVLAWMVRACLEWQRSESLGAMPWRDAVVQAYARSSDSLRDFLEQTLVPCTEGSVPLAALWQRYSLGWAPENVQRPLKRRAFVMALRERAMTVEADLVLGYTFVDEQGS